MNNHATYRITAILLCISAAAFLLPYSADAGRAGAPKVLSAELRGNENRHPIAGERIHNGLHFLLKIHKNVRVFQEWCSWGYFNRWIVAVEIGGAGKKYTFKRKPRGWTKNFPAYHELKKGEFLITDIDLCDGSWQVEPQLPSNKMFQLKLTGHYTVVPDKESRKYNVWTGELVTNSVVLTVYPECADKLNKKR